MDTERTGPGAVLTLAQALRQSEQALEAIINAVADPIFVKDREHRWVLLNDACCSLIGHSRDALLGHSDFEFFPDTEARVFWEKDEAVFQSGQTNVNEESFTDAAGVTHTIVTRKSRFEFNDQTFIVGVIRDITERKLLEDELRTANESLISEIAERRNTQEALIRRAGDLDAALKQLKQAEHAKNEFVARISHELRTPLTLILAPLESLMGGEHRGDVAPLLATMHNNGVRLLHMITSLLDFSRIEAGRVEVRREPVDVLAVTRAILTDFAPLLASRQLSAQLTTDLRECQVELDRYLYERIVFNLLSNAAKFSAPGSEVTVRLAHDGEILELSVQDRGDGIAVEDRPRLFQKFSQIDTTPTRRFEGTGLGLALVREFSELMEGQVLLDSQPGEGSTFTVRVPAARVAGASHTGLMRSQPVPVPQPIPPAPAATELPRVLIVEDNAEMAAYIRAVLEREASVRVVDDAAEALAVIHAWKPALVLSDVMMPGRDGFTLCRDIKADAGTQAIPVVLLSAVTQRQSLLRGWEAGCDDYLFKPFHPEELRTRVRSLIAAAQARADLDQLREDTTRLAALLGSLPPEAAALLTAIQNRLSPR